MGHRAPIVRLLLLHYSHTGDLLRLMGWSGRAPHLPWHGASRSSCPACGTVQGVDTKMIENQIASVELNRPWIDYAMCKRCRAASLAAIPAGESPASIGVQSML